MKNVLQLLIISIFICLFANGCSHTNELAKYKLVGLRFVSESYVEADAANVHISFDHLSSGGNPISDILIAVGEGITAAQATMKLENAVKPSGVAASISHGFEQDLIKYLDVQALKVGEENPDLYVKTLLQKLEIHSGSSGVYMKIKAETTIIDRASAAIIWQNWEETDMPIRRTDAATGVPVVGTIVGIVNAAEFFKLSEKEIQDLVLQTAEGVGYLMGETLRDDAMKAKKK